MFKHAQRPHLRVGDPPLAGLAVSVSRSSLSALSASSLTTAAPPLVGLPPPFAPLLGPYRGGGDGLRGRTVADVMLAVPPGDRGRSEPHDPPLVRSPPPRLPRLLRSPPRDGDETP